MGPQLVRCGMHAHRTPLHHGRNPSMGPQLVRCGMSAGGPLLRLSGIPSMGPQLVRCGMRRGARRRPRTMRTFNGAATCSLRNVRQRRPSCQTCWPSMGPQLVRCGMPFANPLTPPLNSLQWGRNLFVAECNANAFRFISAFNLQWGRNLFVAE